MEGLPSILLRDQQATGIRLGEEGTSPKSTKLQNDKDRSYNCVVILCPTAAFLNQAGFHGYWLGCNMHRRSSSSSCAASAAFGPTGRTRPACVVFTGVRVFNPSVLKVLALRKAQAKNILKVLKTIRQCLASLGQPHCFLPPCILFVLELLACQKDFTR